MIQVENEGVIAASGILPGVGDGGNAVSGTYRGGSTRSYNSAGSSEIEDLINDILTIEQ
ncbi:hypothetical protein [Bacteroides helcogenes]|uniref:hypothetical protein n=1 Tax=Bacteroides helcogenes TaxID=290053 RepID=UPI002A914928|nr:hypothetical protein [Bacteroides helcogenes]MDY5237604.1 hypothetical protein [Bacteroides helcogenes]